MCCSHKKARAASSRVQPLTHLRSPRAQLLQVLVVIVGRTGLIMMPCSVAVAGWSAFLEGQQDGLGGCGQWVLPEEVASLPGAPGCAPVVADTVLSTASSRFSAAFSWACSQEAMLSLVTDQVE